MAEVTFMVGGREVTAGDLAKVAAAQPKAKRAPSDRPKKVANRADAKYSMGFLVTGFTREHIEKAKALHVHEREAAIEHNRRLGGHDPLRVAIPAVWDEAKYLRTSKPFRVRTKPFELKVNADDCAALAIRSGWLNVQVTEDIRA
jgi:hypothetical protein